MKPSASPDVLALARHHRGGAEAISQARSDPDRRTGQKIFSAAACADCVKRPVSEPNGKAAQYAARCPSARARRLRWRRRL